MDYADRCRGLMVTRLMSLLALACAITPIDLAAQTPSLDYATFAVEATGYSESETEPGTYSTAGTFLGVGRMYFSPTRMIIRFDGLIGLGKYDFSSDRYLITSLIPISDTKYAFEAVFDSVFDRTATGRIEFTPPTSGLSIFSSTIEYFQLDEWGQMIEGVLRRYSLPSSAPARQMIEKYDDIDFGGLVAFDPG